MGQYRPIVAFINGVPGSGKDEFYKLLKEVEGNTVINISSIDCVRDLLEISREDKRPEARKVLSLVGDALEEYNEFRSHNTVVDILYNLSFYAAGSNNNPIIFVHTRERYMIDKITKMIRDRKDVTFPIETAEIMMFRPDIERQDYSNKSDHEALRESINLAKRTPDMIDKCIYYYDADLYNDETGLENNRIGIDNSGTLEDLKITAKHFMPSLINRINEYGVPDAVE